MQPQRGNICGLRFIALENGLIRLIVLSECEAKITRLNYKPADYNFLWRNPGEIIGYVFNLREIPFM